MQCQQIEYVAGAAQAAQSTELEFSTLRASASFSVRYAHQRESKTPHLPCRFAPASLTDLVQSLAFSYVENLATTLPFP